MPKPTEATTEASRQNFEPNNRDLFLSTDRIGELNPHTDKEWRLSDYQPSTSDDSSNEGSDDSVQLVCGTYELSAGLLMTLNDHLD